MNPRAITRQIASSDPGIPCRHCLERHHASCVWVAAGKWARKHPAGVVELLLGKKWKEARDLIVSRWERFFTWLGRWDHG